jgi:branched-chain amino acid transport system substrate-binding protein
MKKKGLIKLFGSICILLLIVSFMATYAETAPASKAPIKIGMDNATSGPFANLGKYTTMAFRAWVKKVNREGGILGHPIELYMYDNESDTTKAVLNVKKLINDDKVHLVVGESATGLALAVGPVCGSSKCVYLSQAGSTVFEDKMKEAGPEAYRWCFRMNNIRTEAEVGMYLQILVKKHGVKKIAILHGEEALGRYFKDVTVKLAPRFGIDVVEVLSFPADAVTFGAQISRIKAHPEIEALPVLNMSLAGSLCIAALRDAGIMLPVVGNMALAGAENMKLEKVRTAYKVAPVYLEASMECVDSLPRDHIMKKLLLEWRDFLRKECGIGGDTSAEALGMPVTVGVKDVLTRLLKGQPNIFDKDLATVRSAIRDYFETVKDLNTGLAGVYTMSPDNHSGWKWGTGFVMAKYGQDEKWYYVPESYLPSLPPEK